MKDKSFLREEMLRQRAAVSPEQRMIQERKVCEMFVQLIDQREVKVLHTFLPMGDELNHRPVIQHALNKGITVVTPETLPKRVLRHLVLHSLDELEDGRFGTQHPQNSTEWVGEYDLIMVPGLAFDAKGYRLGYGGGYYDTFLAHHPATLKIAPAFPFQLIDQVPVEQHDIRVDHVYS